MWRRINGRPTFSLNNSVFSGRTILQLDYDDVF